MPSCVYIQLEKVAAPRIITDGRTVEVADERLIVKDVNGTVIATFKDAAVSGWWMEELPADLAKFTTPQLEAILKFIEENRTDIDRSPEAVADAS